MQGMWEVMGETVGDGLAVLKQVYAQGGDIGATRLVLAHRCIHENPPATGTGDMGGQVRVTGSGLAALEQVCAQ
jgi:hypothetical protein